MFLAVGYLLGIAISYLLGIAVGYLLGIAIAVPEDYATGFLCTCTTLPHKCSPCCSMILGG